MTHYIDYGLWILNVIFQQHDSFSGISLVLAYDCTTNSSSGARWRAHMGRFSSGQHFLALNVTKSHGFTGLQLLEYFIYVQKLSFPLILGQGRWEGLDVFKPKKILPGNVCRKGLKFQEIPGKLYFLKTSEKWLKSGKFKKIRPLLL